MHCYWYLECAGGATPRFEIKSLNLEPNNDWLKFYTEDAHGEIAVADELTGSYKGSYEITNSNGNSLHVELISDDFVQGDPAVTDKTNQPGFKGVFSCRASAANVQAGTCPYENDGECDVPEWCPEGTDRNDCDAADDCPYQNDGSCDEEPYGSGVNSETY